MLCGMPWDARRLSEVNENDSSVHRRNTWMLSASSTPGCPVLMVNVVSWLTSALVSPLPDTVTDRLSVTFTVIGDSMLNTYIQTQRWSPRKATETDYILAPVCMCTHKVGQKTGPIWASIT